LPDSQSSLISALTPIRMQEGAGHLLASSFFLSFFVAELPFAHIRLAKLVVFMTILAGRGKMRARVAG